MNRILEQEWLESAPHQAAQRNLRDLARINRWFGGHRCLLKVLAPLSERADPVSILDVGAASGDAAGCLERAYPNSRVVSMDLNPSHLAQARGCRVAGDAFRPPFRPGTFDIVLCSLLLHHFDEAESVRLLRALLPLAKRHLVVIDLHRHAFPKRFLLATRFLFGWSPMTVHDGSASVAAGFTPDEMGRLAAAAGQPSGTVNVHWPWFRLSLVLSR